MRGGATTLVAQAATFLLKLGSVMVLARLLAPEDFGLIAMVVTVTGFLEMFRDAGLSMATIQRAEITHTQVSTLFWLNVALSMALMLATAALGPPVAWFYREPRLIAIMLALSSTLLVGRPGDPTPGPLEPPNAFRNPDLDPTAFPGGGDRGSHRCGHAGAPLLGPGHHDARFLGRHDASHVALVWLATRSALPWLRRGPDAVLRAEPGRFQPRQPLFPQRRQRPHRMVLGARVAWTVRSCLHHRHAAAFSVEFPTLGSRGSYAQRHPVRPGTLCPRIPPGGSVHYYAGMPLAALIGVMADEIVLVVFGQAWLPSASILRMLSLVERRKYC